MTPNSSHIASPLSQIDWTPGIGDPTIVGWLTVLAYFVAFLFSVACAKQMGREMSNRDIAAERNLWWFIALALLLLGINKQLDLQTLLMEAGRMLARHEGWYEQRRRVQGVFIAGITCGGFFSLLIVWRTFRTVWQNNWLTILGVIFLIGFVIVRAASFHHMDFVLDLHIAGIKISWIPELTGIFCILISSMMNLRRLRIRECGVASRRNIFI
jgi:hypothetical protein